MRSDDRLFSYRERFALLRACFAQQLAEKRVILSVLELSLPKPNFTFETLAALARLCLVKPVIVIGADQAAQIGHWHRARELMGQYEFIVFGRGVSGAGFDARLRHRLVADFDVRISATQLRSTLLKLPRAQRLAAALATL